MPISKTVQFTVDDKAYEIRADYRDGRFYVRAYLGNTPANGYEYSVDEITNFDFTKSQGINAVDHLIDVARSDVQNKVWEKYLAAVEALKKQP